MNIREKILVIEDEKSIAQFIAAVLDGQGYETIQARSGQEGLSMITSHCPDLVILDLGLPDMDGLERQMGARGAGGGRGLPGGLLRAALPGGAPPHLQDPVHPCGGAEHHGHQRQILGRRAELV